MVLAAQIHQPGQVVLALQGLLVVIVQEALAEGMVALRFDPVPLDQEVLVSVGNNV